MIHKTKPRHVRAAFMTVAACVVSFVASGVDLPAPIVWYDMELLVDGKIPDKSGNGHDLTLGAGCSIVDPGIGCKALCFNGTTDAWGTFTCPAVTNMTIAFWLYREAEDASIITEQNAYPYAFSGYSGLAVNWYRNAKSLSLINRANDPNSHFSSALEPDRAQWHHVAFTVADIGTDSNSGFKILECRSYLDGSYVKTTVWTNNAPMKTGEQTVCVGNFEKAGTRPLNGKLADMRFYGNTLSAGQVAQTAMEGLTASGPHLLLHYPFDEITTDGGTPTTSEASGNGPAMSLGSNMTLADDGVSGKALRFLDTTQIGGKTHTADYPVFTHTITCWLRRTSAAKNYHAVVNNRYPRFYHGLSSSGGYATFDSLDGNGRGFSAIPNGAGTTTKVNVEAGLADIDTWSHLAVVTRVVTEGADAGKGIIDVYVNGEQVPSYKTHAAFDLMPITAGRDFIVGNNEAFNGTRYFCGDMDDFRLYVGALTSNEVRRVYRGLAAIDAGADFTVTGGTAILAGTVAANAGGGHRPHGGGYAGATAWSLVSAPAGGEGAVIEQPAAAVTRATLPVAGTYVFRLTISDLGASASDDVTVTRAASAVGNAAPTVSLSATATAMRPAAATLSAAVSDDGKPEPASLRVFWMKKSGPGGVWFDPPHAAATKAYFSEAGTYVLTCTADDGQESASADVTVTVADDTDGARLDDGLLRYWSLDGCANPYFCDTVSGTATITAPNYTTLKYLPGKVGYGARAFAHAGEGAYFEMSVGTGEVGNSAYSSNQPPTNDYLTVSAWIYIDPADTNDICGATVVGQANTFGLRYSEKSNSDETPNTGGFTLYQQGRSGNDTAANIWYTMVHYPTPEPSPVGRWMHICGILARNVSNRSLWEMWYDGVKQTSSKDSGSNVRGRVNTEHVMIGGMKYTAAASPDSNSYNANWSKDGTTENFYSRTFPGIVDEVRIWQRKLTEGEIRYLAANPVVAQNRAPAVDAFAKNAVHAEPRTPMAVATAVFDDGEPAGEGLTYRWSVVSGDASKVEFGDATARETTFTASKTGVYVLQLAVSDGERTSYSEPLTVEASAGFILTVW